MTEFLTKLIIILPMLLVWMVLTVLIAVTMIGLIYFIMDDDAVWIGMGEKLVNRLTV